MGVGLNNQFSASLVVPPASQLRMAVLYRQDSLSSNHKVIIVKSKKYMLDASQNSKVGFWYHPDQEFN
jgi:hypothetical protein